jgi:pimeloyl-ACP methyl ester carboxylesterase
VVAIDRPGFGRSTYQRRRRLLDWPADVAALADELGIERFAVAGYSSGGEVRAGLRRRAARAVNSRVALVAGVGPPDTPRFRDGLGPRERLTITLATRARPLALVYWRLARRMLDRRPEAFVAEFEKEASEPDRAVLQNPDYRSTLIATSREALRAGAGGLVQDVAIQARPWGFRLEELTLPVRLWHGDQDQVVSLHHSQHVADAIPDAQLRTYEGEGHLLAARFAEIASELAAAQGEPSR